MNNMTTSEAIRNLEDSLVCVKAMIFRRFFPSGHIAYATVLCCVPKECYGKTKIVNYDGKCQPESCGTFIRAIGFELITPNRIIPLTRYEKYLEKEGWKFVSTIKSARNKKIKDAFELGRLTIETIKSLYNKI